MKTFCNFTPARMTLTHYGIVRVIPLTVVLLVMLFLPRGIAGQTWCSTPATTSNGYFDWSSAMRSSQNNNHYCLKVYMHVIRMSDGTGGQTTAAVNQAYQILQQDFAPHQIYFQWDGSIDYIDNDAYYNNGGAYIFSVNNHGDGIDIYLFHDQGSSGGQANGVGSSSEFYVSGSYWDFPYDGLVTSHVISHEMGHVLFLWHTHHGTFNEGTPGECAELVDGSNGLQCGDLVPDTPADPHLMFNIDATTCTWTDSDVDANGDPYDPDEENIMAYTNPECMDYFTPMQGERMRNAIESLPFLQACLVNNCPNCSTSQTADLMIRDSAGDNGSEPNTVTTYMWTSEDIWVRHEADQGLDHENPEYHPSQPNHVYVRIINRSCVASNGTEQLDLYWAKAATSLAWDYHWTGNPFPGNGPLMGNVIGSATIPSLAPGEEVILSMPWLVPDPNDYSVINAEPWHFCLLARIISSDDPMSTAETADLNANTRNNNNIAWKNITVLDVQSNSGIGAAVGLYNPLAHPALFRLDFEPDKEWDEDLLKESEIIIKFDDGLISAWTSGGMNLENMKRINDSEFLITGAPASISGLDLSSGQTGTVALHVHFLTRKTSEKSRFICHLVQREMTTSQIIGGETFDVRRSDRPLFTAQTTALEGVLANEPVVIEAQDIQEAAIYNWYNSAGELIYVGRELVIAPSVAEKYRLEVISATDGFKDYTEVDVTLRPSSIDLITPNPADDQTVISYTLNGVTSAYLMLMNYQGGGDAIFNYVLNLDEGSIALDTSALSTGYYSVALVCDGVITDAQILSIH